MAKEWVIRDPVHGYIEPTQQEIDIIDTLTFQRLRGIKQLANTFMVFPGATHTRFEHSYGTMHMAGQMAKKINTVSRDEVRVRRLRLAALLHDLGHGPFSHVSEDIVNRVLGIEKFDNVAIALDAVQLEEDIRTHLGGDVDAVVDLLGNKEKASVDRDILDSTLDADKLDYLVRDSHHAGVPYGRPDTLHILHTLREIQGASSGESYLGITKKGIEAVYGLRVARFHMHSVVYNHKVRRIADAMLVRAAVSAIDENKVDSRHFEYKKGDVDFLHSYFEFDDRSLMDVVVAGGGESGELMKRLRERRLLKKAFERDISDFVGPTKKKITGLTRDKIAALEEEIAEQVGVSPFLVIIDRQSVENPTYRAPVGAPPSENVLVEDTPKPKYLHEMPGPWSSEVKSMQKMWVFSEEEKKDQVEGIAKTVFENL